MPKSPCDREGKLMSKGTLSQLDRIKNERKERTLNKWGSSNLYEIYIYLIQIWSINSWNMESNIDKKKTKKTNISM